jgi:hypothetical protein
MLERGEGRTLEFKATLRYDLRTNTANRDLAKVIAKTAAAFLNTDGGSILIGIGDNHTILGIDRDLTTLSKPTLDGFELALRNTFALHLGADIGPLIGVGFISVGALTVAHVTCPRHSSPVFHEENGRREFYVRDGNQSRPLDVRATHNYIREHWESQPLIGPEAVREAVASALQEHLAPLQSDALRSMILEAIRETLPAPIPAAEPSGDSPPWLKVGTHRVLDLFLAPLARSSGWKRLFLISPWISDIASETSLTSDQLCKRMQDDQTTAYIVTRPPEKDWHEAALARLGATGRANVALVPDLHTKLYTAETHSGSFALLGSANFTQQALANIELGLLVNAYADGRHVVTQLHNEAAQLYRLPQRRVIYHASFRMN